MNGQLSATGGQPNVEERLTAAAFTILTDDNTHSHDAELWAVRFMRMAARGKETAFLRTLFALTNTARTHAHFTAP